MLHTLPPTTVWLRPDQQGAMLISGPELRRVIGADALHNAQQRDTKFPAPAAQAGRYKRNKKFYVLDEIIAWVRNYVVGDATDGGPAAVRRAINREVLAILAQGRQRFTDHTAVLSRVDALLAEASALLDRIDEDD